MAAMTKPDPAESRWRVLRLKQTASTNDEAAAYIASGGVLPVAFVADHQTAGRGQHGRAWSSPPGAGLYASFAFQPALDPAQVPLLSLVGGLAVLDLAQPWLPVKLALKWPNDVWVSEGAQRGRKLAGILVEGSVGTDRVEHIVLGVGLNLREVDRGPGVDAVSVEGLADGASASVPDMEGLARALAQHLDTRLQLLQSQGPSAVVAAWRPRAFGLGERAVWTDDRTTLEGTFVGVSEGGAARLDTGGEVRELHHGRFVELAGIRPPKAAER
ncbi:MAG: biotin--[acetyl-CoA-carboxylase] ligase [Myxococcota bacterium]